MLDIHCHILPGVDDGAKTMADSIAMLDTAAKLGITTIVATPHMKMPNMEEYGGRIRAAYNALLPEATQRGITLLLGCEFYAHLLQDVGLDQVHRFCIQGTNRLLLEFHPGHVPSRLGSFCNDLRMRNIVPIIAHPERYAIVQEKPEMLQDAVAQGVQLQINGRSISANPFDKTSNTAKKLLKLYPNEAFLSSDAHNVDHYKGLAAAQKKYNRMRTNLP